MMPPATPQGSAPVAAARRFITPGYATGFAVVVSLFFLWAVANNFNDILIRQFQKALDLNRAQAGFIQFVFYIGYFVMALPAGLVLRRFGYRAGILAGLGFYAVGALLFYPAAEVREYAAFLGALFVLASGAAFLETAANPYIVAFGDPARAEQRLNLAQAFNGLGGAIAPVIGARFIFSGVEHDRAALDAMAPAALDAYRATEAQMVQLPYLVLAGIVVLIALAIAVVRLPEVPRETGGDTLGGLRSVLGVRLLRWAVVAQFFYVGAQVGVWSFFVDFVKTLSPATPEREAAYLLSISLALFLVGRLVGTALMHRIAATRLLAGFAVANIALMLVAALGSGMVAIGALLLTGFFMSIMFPTIFSLGVRDLGTRAPLGAPLIVMAVIGGAVFPPAMGWLSHGPVSIQMAMLVPCLSFAVVLAFALAAARSVQR
ncbi:L-fucose:H+ symporter permease [Sphingomonas sp. 2R-10]|uniref:L-fucose:H+ symporter permease n=1 Tax=Sphingomonas sp. 2R-10 TaxID=3045148 RepID=UPI0019CF9269|nr:L-fucose:H+ symporter permease [Sphingomonas sp. 2R-10]MDJ0278250.1 L-fucose:H+ symporter permease [Sphingomonas sp. 2R-10]